MIYLLEDEYTDSDEIDEELSAEEEYEEEDEQTINGFTDDEMIYDNLSDISDDNESYVEQRLISEKNENEWSDSNTPIQLESFDSFPGVQTVPTDHTNIFGIVDMLFDNEFFTYLTRETNRYYLQHFKRNIECGNNNQLIREPDVTESEMKTFLGIVIFTNIINFRQLRDFWRFPINLFNDENSESVNYDRFKHIWKYWHFNNNDLLMNNPNRLSKIQPILNHFLPKFQEMYNPEREVYLKERVMPWAHIFCKQYSESVFIPGILLTSLCESRSGYVINMDIHTKDMSKTPEQRLLSVLRPIFGKWHFLYRFNLVNGIRDAETLLSYKIRMCTVMEKSDDLPDVLINLKKTMKYGETVFRKKNDILALIHKGGNSPFVNCLSTIHDAETIKIINSQSRVLTFSDDKPVCILDHLKYTPHKSPTDLYFVNYALVGRFGKWSKKVVLYIINSALYNSFILFKKMNSTKILKYEEYLLHIVEKWILQDQFDQEEQQHQQ